ncbi:MAG: tetratricopeptide repeat protein [Gemmatimonadaceae bacterium]
MAEPATGFERDFEQAAYSPVPSTPVTPSDSRAGEPTDSAQAELASLIRLGTIKQDAGSFAEAQDCFRRALDVGDRMFGPDNPDLIILLNDVTRLYLKQSAYTSAEPLLLRLLEFKRSKGEDHPEVATVLASLATVRQGLGMHESAEQLWRKVVDIRERTLAPNHLATASALEHLGDACAARGKIREALSAFQHALTIREKTLGEEHPSLRVARERIADLQLQASDDMLDSTSFGDTPSTPDRYRLLSGGISADVSASRFPPPLTSTAAPPTRMTAQVAARPSPITDSKPSRGKKSASLMIPRGYMPPAAPAIDVERDDDRAEPVRVAMPSIDRASQNDDGEASLKTANASYRDALESLRQELDGGLAGETIGERISQVFAPVMAFFGARQVVATITIVVLGLLGVAVARDKYAFGESGQPVVQIAPTVPSSGLVATAAAEPIPTPVSNGSNAERSSAKAVKPRVVEERSPARKAAEKKPEAPARVSIPRLSTAVLSDLDSIAAKAAAVGNHTRDPVNVQTNLPAMSQRRPTFDDDQANAPQRARLIGELPAPKVPAQVADVEGEVRVRFNVDSLGRPVLESFAVVSSPNPLLTAAVRKVIPTMRFEPAKTAGPEVRSIGDIVQIGFQFTRSR